MRLISLVSFTHYHQVQFSIKNWTYNSKNLQFILLKFCDISSIKTAAIYDGYHWSNKSYTTTNHIHKMRSCIEISLVDNVISNWNAFILHQSHIISIANGINRFHFKSESLHHKIQITLFHKLLITSLHYMLAAM